MPPRPDAVARALGGAEAPWDGRGTVRVTGTHLVFEGGHGARRTSRRTVAGVALAGTTLWVRRRRAHDWLVQFESEAAAARVARQLGTGR